MKINSGILVSSLVGGIIVTLTILALIFGAAEVTPPETIDDGNYFTGAHSGLDTYYCTQFKPAGEEWGELDCVHNVLTDAGREHIEGLLGGKVTSGYNTTFLALGNGTTPVAGSTTLDNELATCGLTRVGGAYYDLGTGWWEVNTTFTYTCDNSLLVNHTASFNATSAGTLLAGGVISDVTFTTNGDQLRLRHNCTISEA